MKSLTFPVKTSEFIRYQEAGIGRALSADERAMIPQVVEYINDAYQAGREGRASALASMDPRRLAEGIGKEGVRRTVTAVCLLCNDAWSCGRKEASLS